ncbi:CRISPR-associated endonuclease Cas1 [Synechococcales cyanobacterium C]|uniref:CRISPR-associated endonuclease Cas1 n=1 Tax=Petrachloros mirabilis ULC683 TaxID=2781853 RepID=A0A8K2A1L2_9CYAN|nr:CRISPR-associated endonuclease Cas1 [Petrachloros mirabilis]NCJ08006.1 CRISPR-associated endonuclease Cas1 [Petrachloros mirabilis ULC683]
MNISLTHLILAWKLVKQGSPAAGVDGMTTALFASDLQPQLQRLERQLQRETYLSLLAKGFLLRKKQGGHRLIGIPAVRDRIVQRLILQACYPAWEERLSECAHAYRPGYSIHSAIERLMLYYRHEAVWTIKVDIHEFFDHLNWSLLISQLEAIELHPWLIQLIEQQLKSGVVLKGRFQPTNQGVLQGAILSGALANLYLYNFDQQCLEAGIPLVRYGDDCVATFPSWVQANRALELMQSWLAELYLDVHPEKTQIVSPQESFTFLGHHFQQGKVSVPVRKPRQKKQQSGKSTGRHEFTYPKVCNIVHTQSKKQKTKVSPEIWKQEMTTLYLTEQGSYLRVKHQQFRVYYQKELRCSVPINRVSHIVIFGCCQLSHGTISLALSRHVPILYLSHNGKYFGRLETAGQAQVKYLIQQVHKSQDQDFVLSQARSMVAAKLHNARMLLKRLSRRRKTELAKEVMDELKIINQEKIISANSIEVLLGHEGHASQRYFRAFSSLLKDDFQFDSRNRRPPKDPVNSLLSLGYTLLSQNIHSMVEVAGLHTHFGNLHKPRSNHPALVSDLVEEFRALVVDSLVAYLVNSGIVKPEDFTPPDERGGVYLHPATLKVFLHHWSKKLETQVTHPHTGYKVSYRRCMELQVWEYIACLQGDQPVYRAMRWDA